MRKSKIIATASSVAAVLAMAGASVAIAAPTDNATITLNAAPGNTLAGHTFTFYKLANYGDVSPDAGKTKVTGFSATAPDNNTKTWAENAIKAYNNEDTNPSNDVKIPTAYDASGPS